MSSPLPARTLTAWILLALGVVLFGGILTVLLSIDRQDALSKQSVLLDSLASVVEKNLSGQLLQIDRVLERASQNLGALDEELADSTESLPGLRALVQLSSTGKVARSALKELLGRDFSQNGDFSSAKSRPVAQDPKGSTITTTSVEPLTVVFSRSVRGFQGEFLGQMQAVVDVSEYRSLLESVRFTPEVSVRLLAADQELVTSTSASLLGAELGNSEPRTVAVRKVAPQGVNFSAQWAVEVSRSQAQVVAHLAQTEGLSWVLFCAAALSLGALVFRMQTREVRHTKEVGQYTDLVQDSSIRFQLATEAAHLGVWEWDPLHDRLSWDEQMFRLYGMDASKGTPSLAQWFDLIVTEDREQAEGLLRQALQVREACHRMFRVERADGSQRWIQCNSRYYGGSEGFSPRVIGINEDITQRVQSATSLMERERFLKLVTETTHAMIAYYSPDEVCRFSNLNYAKRHGYFVEEIIGMTMRGVLGDELYQSRREVIDSVLSGHPQELQTASSDLEGNEAFLWIHYEPDLQAGVLQGFFVIVDDITELKKARDQLETQQGKLILSARMAQMGELLNLISHQWRQPLTVISALVGNVQLRSQLGSLDSEYLLPKLDKITQTVQNMSGTIESFRAFFSPSTVKERADLVGMTRRALDILSPVLQKSSLEVRFEPSSEALWAHVFQSELMQVVIEILGNARHALRNSAEPGWVRLSWQRQGSQGVLTISNNGGAIPPSILPKIFEPYFSTKPDGTGTGMGLFMAKVIVESHHSGTLRVFCEESVTSFRISLPIEELAP